MKVAIVGSRDFNALHKVCAYVQTLEPDTLVISGNARGVDETAQRAALARALPVLILPADWERYGKAAGFIRNEQIVKMADKVVAFWNGKSRGTAHDTDLARKYGKELEIILEEAHER